MLGLPSLFVSILLIPILLISIVFLSGFFTLSLLGSTNVSATSTSGVSTFTTQLVGGIAVRVLDSTATSEISSLDFSLLANPSGTFAKDSMNLEVSTTNPTGYKLYMSSSYLDPTSTPSSPVYTTSLVNTEDSSYTIPTLSTTNVTESDFSSGSTAGTSDKAYVNKWGYSLNDDNEHTASTITYNPVPDHTTPSIIRTTNTQGNRSLTKLTIALNADMSKASGIYQNTLVFSAIANPIPTNYTLSFNLDGGSAPSSDPDAFDDMTASEVAASHTFTIPSTIPEKTGYNFTNWILLDASGQETATTYNPGDTITVVGNEEYVGNATLKANWSLASYTITISNSNTTSGAASIEVPYGGSTTVTVTPSSGYYLSSVSCPSGYTCSGYNTGTSYTGQQTVTVANNNTDSGGTLAFTGTVSYPTYSTPSAGCGAVSTNGRYYADSVLYIKLADNKCYTASSRGAAQWASASSLCPSGTHLPTQSEFNTLVGSYSGGGLYTATGWSGGYWSATAGNSSRAYVLNVISSNATVNFNPKTLSYNVVCMAG